MSEPEPDWCDCLPPEDQEFHGTHTKVAHTNCITSFESSYCGGCDSCIAMQVSYYKMKAEEDHNETQDGKDSL